MTILHLSDTHGLQERLGAMPPADVIVHSGDFTHSGTEEEVLDFLNWFISLDYPNKIFVVGNHDLCLWDAEDIEDLPSNVHFLQDRSITIDGVKFFGLGYNHPEELIDPATDVLITHEPPLEILDYSMGMHWGNLPLRERVELVKPQLHLFGHAHESYGTTERDGIIFSNGSLLDDYNKLVNSPRMIQVSLGR
ncbi:MAG: metallophosphatase domain-containing protein [Muribaculaceae bacterium]|nr:metallophosphatase domain-containing protein [Muribaculaceae bacterium]